MRYVLMLCLQLLHSTCFAQVFPSRPVWIVLPYSAGGATSELMARALQDPLAKELGQQVLIEYKPGAGGMVGAREVAKASPDGHVLLFGNNGPNAIGPQLSRSAGYDPIRDFAPVSLVAVVPLILTVNAGVPAKDVRGLIEYARSRPGLEYGTVGVGSFGYLATEVFARSAGLKLTHVPYKSSGQVAQSLLAGEIKMAISAPSETVFNHVKAGKLRLLGASSPKPTPLAMNAPPIAEAVPGFVMQGWFGLFAPAGTPEGIVNRLSEAIQRILAQGEMQQRFLGYGFAATSSSPQEFSGYVREEVQRWGRVIRETGVSLD